MKRREPADKWYRDILRAVQHSRCACCGETRDDLQVAHVQLHAEGRESIDVNRPENLVLACEGCNLRYKRRTMPTPHLPPDFLEQVAGIVLLKLQPKLGVERAARFSGTGCTILTSKFTENTEVIDWQNSDFGLQNSTICTFMQAVDAEAVLQRFLVEATRYDPGPILPTGRNGDDVKQEMRRTMNAVGELRWLATARFYLRKEFYLQADGRAKWDSFGELAYNFATYDSRRVQDERKQAEDARANAAMLKRIHADQMREDAELQRKREEREKEDLMMLQGDAPVDLLEKSTLFNIFERTCRRHDEYANQLYYVQRDDAFYALRRDAANARQLMREFIEGAYKWAAMTVEERNEVKQQLHAKAEAQFAELFPDVTPAGDGEGEKP